MKRRTKLYFFLSLSFLTCAVSAQTPMLEKILAAHYDAIGQDQIMSLRSLALDVREIDGFGGGKKYQIIKKVPFKIRIEGEWQGQKYVSAYDGVRAWTIAPWTGVKGAQLMTDREGDLLLLDAAMGSPLYPYKGTEYTLDLYGSETFQGAGYYVIRRTSPSGFYVDYLVSKKDYLILLVRIYSEAYPDKVEKEVVFKNYKNLGGFSIPFGFENRAGRVTSDIIIDNIIFGQGAAESLFEKPVD